MILEYGGILRQLRQWSQMIDVGLKYDNTDLEDENTVSYLDFPIMLQPLTFTIIASSIQFRLASIFAVSIFMNSSCSK